MSFLFPLYLLGAAALAVPIMLHLRRRPPKEHIPFSSHMFLEQTPEKLTRRTRLERWLLLALRCLALLLLAFAFGRPFLNTPPEAITADSLERKVILIDRSASMKREDLWDQALSAAKDQIEDSNATAEVTVAFFDNGFEEIASLSAWRPLSPGARSAALDSFTSEKQSQPSWQTTDLGAAMTRAADLLLAADIDDPATSMEVVVISDFQSGADQSTLQNEAWPSEVQVRCVALTPEESGNLSLALASTPPRSSINDEEVYRVRVQNANDSDFSTATVSWQDAPDTAIETTVAPGTSRIIRTAPRPASAVRGVLTVTGDQHNFDNDVFVSPVQARPLRILVTGDTKLEESAGSALFYLKRALQPTPNLEPIVTTQPDFAEQDLKDIEAVVILDQWSAEVGQRLNQFAESGGLVIALPSADAESDALASLVGDETWQLSEAEGKDFSLLGDIDFEHPVLEPFARARIRDFTKVRFWKHRVLSLSEAPGESTRILATFDGESPAIIEKCIGDGTVFAFLSGWEPGESQLALSSKFVPLLFSIFEHTGFSIRSAPTYLVGETTTSEPGFEETERDGEPHLIAINMNPREGNTTPFDPTVVFPGLGIPLVDETGSNSISTLTEEQLARLESEAKEEKQKLWKWIVFAALFIFVIESILAGRRSHTATAPQLAAT
ncbi:MAG: BatA domain-containing protein [Verrucomicrobiales bacterium]